MARVVREEPSAAPDYLAVCNHQTLEPVARIERKALLLGALRIGGVRLLDNMLVQIRD